MKLISLNIQGKKHLHRWIPALRNLTPDVVCLQEIFLEDVGFAETELGMRGWFAGQAIVPEKNAHYVGGTGEWGNALFSREPLSRLEVHYYRGTYPVVWEDEPTDCARAVIMAEIVFKGAVFNLGMLHFTWSRNGQNTEAQKGDLERLFTVCKKYPELILVGDFNIPRGTLLFTELTARFKSWVPESYVSSLDPVLFRYPDIRVVVDHLFTTDHYDVRDVRLLSGLSDHCAISAVISHHVR